MNQSIIDAAREIVATLVHLKEAPQGVPEHGRAGHESIRAEYARNASSERGPDPLLAAAEKWVADKLSGLAPEKTDAPQETGGKTEPGIPPADEPFATVEHGGVALHDKPLGELSDADLETLTAPKEGGQ